jgi:peptidoglycan/xylan/chitin deacetylase (PgdA/CDA1 family)
MGLGAFARRALRDGLTQVDERALAPLLARFDKPALVSLLFHGVFESRREVESGVVHPQEAMMTSDFAQLIEYFSGEGYRFVGIDEIERGLPEGHYVCITFDDGYASTARIVGLLRAYSIPAAVFVSTDYVESGKRYWWDAVYDERMSRGASEGEIAREIAHLERKLPLEVDRYLTSEFGADALRPRSDLDRPLTAAELRALAADEHVTIGNHTSGHVVLAGRAPDIVRDELDAAQAYLRRTLGAAPTSVSYPEGAYDATTVAIARDLGFESGFTTARRRERLPVAGPRLYELGRFQLRASADLSRQLRATRSELRLTDAARHARRPG